MSYFLHKLNFFTKVVFTSTTFAISLYTVAHKPISNDISAADLNFVLEQNYSSVTQFKAEIKSPYEPVKPRDPRAISLEQYLTKQSSYLADHTDLIVELSDYYGVDHRLIVAIAGAESGFCRVNFRPYNCWGYGKYSWESPEDGINSYMSLMNKSYFSRGATTIETIADPYNPNPETYIPKVLKYYNSIPY